MLRISPELPPVAKAERKASLLAGAIILILLFVGAFTLLLMLE